MQQQLPVLPHERAHILDMLRGFALLGIVIMNTAVLSGYVFISPEERASFFTYAVDKWVDYAAISLFMGKFYSLFAILFGIGFSIFLARKGNYSVRIFYRRLIILMLIGLFHAFLIWDGDILFLYAVLGCLLPLFRNAGNRILILLSISLILSPILIDAIRLLLNWDPGIFLFNQGVKLDSSFNIIPGNFLFNASAGYDEVLKWNTAGFFYRWGDLLSSNRLVKVLGLFLLGLYIGKNLLYLKIEENRKNLKRIFLWSVVIGLPSNVLFAWLTINNIQDMKMLNTISYALGVVPLSLAYASGLCLLWLNAKWKKRLQVMAPAGRMSLTNYMVQSIAGILIYYNIGLGLGTTIGSSLFVILSILVWCIQVIYSKYWFKHFQFGPMEWLWRFLVYGKTINREKTGLKLKNIAA